MLKYCLRLLLPGEINSFRFQRDKNVILETNKGQLKYPFRTVPALLVTQIRLNGQGKNSEFVSLCTPAKCHDSPSNTIHGEGETWEPNDCTVCVCRNGTSECLATVCRHPDCKEPLYIKGQCCPVCPLVDPNSSEHNEAGNNPSIIRLYPDNFRLTFHVFFMSVINN